MGDSRPVNLQLPTCMIRGAGAEGGAKKAEIIVLGDQVHMPQNSLENQSVSLAFGMELIK